ncbi:hypothetical protein MFLAVUS_005043 [Mucor flavus]|uniref:Protein kinase domain-containing protein n=1 Tax=Mucor flavus TaxID=439312 RepID=A0ABP9YXM3_9FUNG
MSSSSFKKRSPEELSWVLDNYDVFDHISFFNHFSTYNKSRAIRRFKVITNSWINNTQRKETLLKEFNQWNKIKKSKAYWEQRAETETEQSDSTSLVSFNDSFSSTSTKTRLTVAPNLTEEVELYFNENIKLPEAPNRYFVDDIDVSSMFHQYQKEAYDRSKKELFSFKSNCNELLCLSSVLILNNNNTNSTLLRVFGRNNLQKISMDTKLRSLAIEDDEFIFETMLSVLPIVKEVLKKAITREEGSSKLSNIGMKLQGTQNIIVRFIKKIVEYFPLDDFGEVIEEDDLKSRYVLPILQALFDNLEDENTVFFKVTNENNAESKQSNTNVSRRRSDGQFRQKAERQNLITIEFMEAKPESEIQVIGSTFTFYVPQKKSEDVYFMAELDKLTFPMNINEVPGIFGYLDRIAAIVEIFKSNELCNISRASYEVKKNKNLLKEQEKTKVRHEHVSLHNIYESDEAVYSITDFCTGGELFQRIVERGCHTEKDASDLVRQLLEGLAYLHSEGLLFKTPDEDAELLITDFGLSRLLKNNNEVLTTACGTPGYVAPEVLLSTGHGTPVDIWSAGVIMYTLLSGYTPFYSEDQNELFDAIMKGDYAFDDESWSDISQEDTEIHLFSLNDPWITNENTGVNLASNIHKGFDSRQTLKSLVTAVAVINKWKEIERTHKLEDEEVSETEVAV